MKRWGCLLGLVIFSYVTAWGQNVSGKFEFVSTLSSPVASFDEVETKRTDMKTHITEGATVFAGSQVSKQGVIMLHGKPLYSEQLVMDNGASITSSPINWLVKKLTIGEEAEVQVDALIAKEIVIGNGEKTYDTITVRAIKKIIAENDIYTRSGLVPRVFQSGGKTGGTFYFKPTSLATGSATKATWKDIVGTTRWPIIAN